MPSLPLRSSRALPARSPASVRPSAASVRPPPLKAGTKAVAIRRRCGGARRTTVVGRAPAGAEGEGGRKEGRKAAAGLDRLVGGPDETRRRRGRVKLAGDRWTDGLVARMVWIDRCLVSVSATMCQEEEEAPSSGGCLEGIFFLVDE